MVSSAQHLDSRHAIDVAWSKLAAIPDPEIPVISIVELGVVRDVACEDGEIVVTVTPTYSGCPATEVIAEDIQRALASSDLGRFRVQTRLQPAWTTDWIAPAARERLRAYGIAPPGERAAASPIDVSRLKRPVAVAISCPRCGSLSTKELSRFGSTPCKAQYRCEDCLEPFDYFKPH
ncbi:MAG TPA: 1,2-phenylacetyl-CoA epoxidase subunit PaaD [Casimicrobiaceae bacterium]|nr:1,2-phenylacetyl-CoA epoxidase subunit PaaD [Casimicrobiaceae bacterium]